MGNRKQPFGYMIEVGTIVINPLEALVVNKIYAEYARGISYSQLTQMLREQPIQYDVDKRWNKNMVARILQDSRYLGNTNFPEIIHPEIAKLVSDRLEKRSKTSD